LAGPPLLAAAVAALRPDSANWPSRARPVGRELPRRLADALLSALRPGPATAAERVAVDGALVLLADHELAASTMAVRIAASFGADPYAAVAAGLAALSGSRHGAASLAVEAMLDELVAADDARRALGGRLRRGETIPGLGHPLYAAGDPRAPRLFELVEGAGAARAYLAATDAVRDVCRDRALPAPNVDLALGALTRGLRLEPGAGEAIFAVARIAGWLAHAAEEYAAPSALRFRATYTGPARL